MQFIGFTIGIASIIIWFVAIMPGLEWLHLLNIPFSAAGFVLSIIGAANARRFRILAMIGMVLCTASLMFSIARYRACTRVS